MLQSWTERARWLRSRGFPLSKACRLLDGPAAAAALPFLLRHGDLSMLLLLPTLVPSPSSLPALPSCSERAISAMEAAGADISSGFDVPPLQVSLRHK